MIEKMICKKEGTLLDVMKLINENAKGVSFIVDNDERLCGVLTDGDIRRLILNGHELQTKVFSVLKKDFVYAKVNETYEEILAKMSNVVKIIPVVNDNCNVIDYFEYRKDIHIPVTAPDLTGNEFKYLLDAFLSTWVSSSGKYIDKFEADFSSFCGCDYGVVVSNGTVALQLALAALGIGEGDEVIVPDLTFAATINAVLHANATPVIVDIEKDSWCINPAEIKRAITPRTKAIIPVHLFGQPCDMGAITEIAKKHNLFIIEDCAQAHGAEFNGKKVGSFSDIGCFSFFGNKVITTGEGGICVTNSKSLCEKMKVLRDHGMSKTKRYWHEVVGYNYRMTNIQAAIGCAQLERIEDILKNRELYEQIYASYFANMKGFTLQRRDLPNRKKISWLMSILVEDGNRDDFINRLKTKGIDARPFFYPLSQMDIYRKYTFSNWNSCEIAYKGANLPTYSTVDKLASILSLLKQI